MKPFESMAQYIPEGEVGDCRIEHFDVSEQDSEFTRLRAIQHPYEYVPPGKYCRLYVNHELMMTDTIHEQMSNREPLYQAKGDVLVAGLGIGMLLVPMLKKLEVRTVTVIEKYTPVIALVEAPLRDGLNGEGDKLLVVEADIFDWKPPSNRKWDVVYFDIWASVCGENLEGITRLKRKFARRKTSWMGAWKEHELRRMRKACRL